MRVLVCGGRDFDDWELLSQHLYQVYKEAPIKDDIVDFTIIEGGAKGADFLARVWAKHKRLPFEEYTAYWKELGKSAGVIRNSLMLTQGKPDLVIAFPGGTGTAHMVKIAKKAGIEVREIKE